MTLNLDAWIVVAVLGVILTALIVLAARRAQRRSR